MKAAVVLARRVRRWITRTQVRVPVVSWRHRGLRQDDVFMAGYTRSGAAWLRFLLYEVLTGNPATFASVNQHVADVGQHARAASLLPGGGRLIKTHELYREEYRKAIYIVRDPRDVMISEYNFYKADGRIACGFDEFFALFLRGKTNGYGSWPENVNSWLDSPLACSGSLLPVRFEDLKRDVETGLAAVLGFLGATPPAERIRAAIANNTVEKMKQKEDRQPQLPADAVTGARYIRSGEVGQWRNQVSDLQGRQLEAAFGETLQRLGYLK